MAMRDWKAIAKASGIVLPEKELDALAKPLQALEEVFRPLVKDLTPDQEPVLEMFVEADSE
jgi:hypothetical protein